MQLVSPSTAAKIRRSLIQSDYITAAWDWFMILAGKAAEPVLVASVLYASVKLLPVVHFAPQWDVVVFIAQFVALDVGGLSLNKLADRAKQRGDEAGATQAKRLSIALVAIMLTGVIMVGVNQVTTLNSHVAVVIDTILLIARAVMAVLYSRVIHALRTDDPAHAVPTVTLEATIFETINSVLADNLALLPQHLEASLSQCLEERLMALDLKQADALAHLKQEQARAITETVMNMMETVAETSASKPVAPRRQTTGTQEIDAIIWPLLSTGLSVRAIAAQA